MGWKKIADKGEVPSGGGKAFKIDDKQVAVFNQDGFHAMDDLVYIKMVQLHRENLKGILSSVHYTFGITISRQES